MRDEPGIGAFVVELRLDPALGTGLRDLSVGETDRLRATRKIVADRARAIFEVRTAMPPPLLGGPDSPG